MIGKKLVLIAITTVVVIAFVVPYIGYSMSDTPKDVREYVVATYSGTYADGHGSISLAVAQYGPEEAEGFWSYWSDFWGGSTGELIPIDNAIFAVGYTILFQDADGKEWIGAITKEYNTAGTFSDSFSFDFLDRPGTYTITVALLLKGDLGYWNHTIASDKEVIVVE